MPVSPVVRSLVLLALAAAGCSPDAALPTAQAAPGDQSPAVPQLEEFSLMLDAQRSWNTATTTATRAVTVPGRDVTVVQVEFHDGSGPTVAAEVTITTPDYQAGTTSRRFIRREGGGAGSSATVRMVFRQEGRDPVEYEAFDGVVILQHGFHQLNLATHLAVQGMAPERSPPLLQVVTTDPSATAPSSGWTPPSSGEGPSSQGASTGATSNFFGGGNGGGGSSTPLLLDLDGDGELGLTGTRQGVFFDVDASGARERTAWTRPQGARTGAFLTLDRNGNGVVDSGLELFGNQHGAANGFVELARYDANRDHRVDAQDPVFARLRLWQDLNGDGVSSPGELKSLAQDGVLSISLDYLNSTNVDPFGNGLFQQGHFERAGGGHGLMVDVWLLAAVPGPVVATR